MPLDPVGIATAVSRGLSIVCATCEKYWDARDKGIEDDKCLAVDGCGGPMAGDVFHEYKGPMTAFDRFCFVCGESATHAIRVKDLVRVIGCCARHTELVGQITPDGKDPVRISVFSTNNNAAEE